MKICLVNRHSLPVLSDAHKHERIGGEEVQHAKLAQALLRQGHEVQLVVADYGQPDGQVFDSVPTIKTYGDRDGLPVVRFIYPRWIKMWRALARADAEVYYVSCAGMEVGLVAMFCKRHGRRMVFRSASDSDCDPQRLLIQYARDKRLYEWGLRHADGVLVQSEWQREAMLRNYGKPSIVAGMLVDSPLHETPPESRDIQVLWVANLREVKRPDRVLDLAQRMPEVHFHMAGGPMGGAQNYYDAMKARAATLPNVSFHGGVPYRDVGQLFDRARIFLNTSDLEGFPNTFLQAWIRGTPTATLFDPDSIVKRKGLGVSATSMDELEQGVRRLLTDNLFYQQTSQASRDHMATEFSEGMVLAPYLQAFGASPAAQRAKTSE